MQKTALVSLLGNNKLISTQFAEFANGANAKTIDFGAVGSTTIHSIVVNGVEVKIKNGNT